MTLSTNEKATVKSSYRAPALCLTCASSISFKELELEASRNTSNSLFRTACCQRPICSGCLSRNPRLRVYNPCLACLAGVDATSKSSVLASSSSIIAVRGGASDGALDSRSGLEVNDVLENEMFTIGDSDDEEELESGNRDRREGKESESAAAAAELSPRPYSALLSVSESSTTPSNDHAPPPLPHPVANVASLSGVVSSSDPSKYYIQPGDTLSALSLRLSVDGRRLARLNGLPPSTLTTTPHLLHTRRFLTLPPNARILSSINIMNPQPTSNDIYDDDAAGAEQTNLKMKMKRERDRARERAEKRFAFVTKEVDYRVAKAYVAVAAEFSDSDEASYDGGEDSARAGGGGDGVTEKKRSSTRAGKESASGSSLLPRSTEARAVDRYLEDEEWEQRELRAGRPPRLPSFKLSSFGHA